MPCIWLDDQAEQAADFYVRTFAGGHVVATSHYPETMDNPGDKPRGSVLIVEFEIAGQRFTALNGGPTFTLNPSISFFVFVDSAVEVDRLYGALADGGEALMPLDRYPWSERYAWIKDRFGVTWQVIAGSRPASGATIVPCLMFNGAQHRKAEQALHQYAAIFPGSRIESIERYTADEGPAGTVKHGRAVVAGHDLVAMDSHIDHGFGFNEGISLQVMCDDQAELDRCWERLSAGGEQGQCGWLKDRFGVSWQVGPTAIIQWMTSADTAAHDRAFELLLQMNKLDIAALEAAFQGH